MFGGSISYVWWLQILRFWRNKSLRFGVINLNVGGVRFLTFGVFKSLRSGVINLRFWGYQS